MTGKSIKLSYGGQDLVKEVSLVGNTRVSICVLGDKAGLLCLPGLGGGGGGGRTARRKAKGGILNRLASRENPEGPAEQNWESCEQVGLMQLL